MKYVKCRICGQDTLQILVEVEGAQQTADHSRCLRGLGEAERKKLKPNPPFKAQKKREPLAAVETKAVFPGAENK